MGLSGLGMCMVLCLRLDAFEVWATLLFKIIGANCDLHKAICDTDVSYIGLRST